MTPFGLAWTPAEDAIIRSSYKGGGVAATSALLPGRTDLAIEARARRLGALRHRRWTTGEDHRLRLLLGEEPISAVAAKLDRTEWSIYRRAQRLDIAISIPRGRESLRAAARRNGFDVGTLTTLLRRAHVPLRAATGCPGRGPGTRVTVDPFDVDQIVARYLESETLASAAARRGIRRPRLVAMLLRARQAGAVDVPKKPKIGKRAWRIPSAVIDRVVGQARWSRWRRSQHASRS